MKNTSVKFELISFHDSIIQEFSRVGDSIYLKINACVLLPNHPLSDNQVVHINGCELYLKGVLDKKLEWWNDSTEAKNHPNPNEPLSTITNTDFSDDTYKLEGFDSDSNWVEWWFIATEFELKWDIQAVYS